MEIIDVVSSPHTVESGQRIIFSFKIVDDGLKDSNYVNIYDDHGSKINFGLPIY
jgi:hypothetical protein|nr:MAG TPA: NigD-like N-terminal OB domain [Caudoviricetes sp.]